MGGARAVFKFRLRLHSKKAAAPTGSVSLTLVETLQNINLSTHGGIYGAAQRGEID